MEAVGFTISVLSLASLFKTCLECFELVELGSNFSRDLEILLTRLETQKIIFAIWGEAVHLDNHGNGFDEEMLGPVARGSIWRLLNCIRMLFEDAGKLKKIYGLKKTRCLLRIEPATPWHRFRSKLVFEQNQAKLSTKIRWAIKDKTKFSNLLTELKGLIEDLQSVTASFAKLEEQRKMFIDEITSVSDVHSLELLEEVLLEDDPGLSEVASQRIVQLTNGSAVETMDLGPFSESAYATAASAWPSEGEAPDAGTDDSSSVAENVSIELETTVSEGSVLVYGHQNNLKSLQQEDKKKLNDAIHKLKSGPVRPTSAQRSLLIRLRDFEVGELFVSIAPIDGDLYKLLGSFQGAPSTSYEGGVFFVRIDIPKDFPFNPPKCRFLTPVFHPNVDIGGQIWMSILQPYPSPNGWNPALSISNVMVSIASLMDDPNWLEPAFPEMATAYGESPIAFEIQARRFTQRYANGKLPALTSYADAFADVFPKKRRYLHSEDQEGISREIDAIEGRRRLRVARGSQSESRNRAQLFRHLDSLPFWPWLPYIASYLALWQLYLAIFNYWTCFSFLVTVIIFVLFAVIAMN